MRILQINAVSGVSSTGRTTTETSDYLNNNGHEGFVAYSMGCSYYNGYKIGSAFDTKIHGLLSRVFGKQGYFSRKATRRLCKYIHKLKPEVVHLRNLHSNYINLYLLLDFLAKNDIPTVITLHDCWFYTGKCTHYTTDGCYKWQAACGGCPRLKKDNPSWFFDQTATMLSDKKKWLTAIPRLAVVGVSDWITNEARKSFLASAKILTRIYNWIDLDVFKPTDSEELRKKLNLHDKFVILGVASGWSNSKGLDKFLEIAELLTEDMIVLLVGRNSDYIDCSSNIIHIDETHNVSELVGYYSLADVYVHLSQEETFGKTIAEALSCGTPAIVLNSTACPEIVDESCGIVVSDNQSISIISAIKEIQKNGKSLYTENARTHVRKHFDARTNMAALLSLYQKLSNNVD